MSAGDISKALSCFEQAQAAAPGHGHSKAQFNRANALCHAANMAESGPVTEAYLLAAVTSYDAILESSPHNWQAHLNRAAAAVAGGKFAVGKGSMQTALKQCNRIDVYDCNKGARRAAVGQLSKLRQLFSPSNTPARQTGIVGWRDHRRFARVGHLPERLLPQVNAPLLCKVCPLVRQKAFTLDGLFGLMESEMQQPTPIPEVTVVREYQASCMTLLRQQQAGLPPISEAALSDDQNAAESRGLDSMTASKRNVSFAHDQAMAPPQAHRFPPVVACSHAEGCLRFLLADMLPERFAECMLPVREIMAAAAGTRSQAGTQPSLQLVDYGFFLAALALLVDAPREVCFLACQVVHLSGVLCCCVHHPLLSVAWQGFRLSA